MQRSLLLACAALACSVAPFALAADDGFMPLFDGKTLDGWEGNLDFWSAKDGVISGQTTAENPTKGNTFLIWRKGTLEDFELRMQFRIVGGNSGIQYRSKDLGNFVVGGYQADFDAGNGWTGTLYEERGRGVLAKRGTQVTIGEDGKKTEAAGKVPEKEIVESVKKEDWNEYVIIAKGNHLVHMVNGKVTVDVTDNQSSKSAASGILALQLHAGPPMLVQFKDIQLKVLK